MAESVRHSEVISWRCSSGASGTVEFDTWDFQRVSRKILQEHRQSCTFTGTWEPPWVHVEVAEDLSEAEVKHVQ